MSCTRRYGEFHDVPQNHGRTVGGDFDHVVGGVRVRLGEVGNYYFVDTLLVWPWIVWRGHSCPREAAFRVIPSFAGNSARATRFDEFPENCASNLQLMLQPKHGFCNRACFGSGKANHANSSPAGRSSDRNDGVIKVQVASD
jgi:hypothetical protein